MDLRKLMQGSIEWIEDRLGDELSVEEAARQTYFSRYYYQRLFSSLVGEPVMEYVKKRRLSLAGEELAETKASIADIAFKYGYDSHEGFTRAFKSYHGITPTQCRKYRLFHAYEKKQILKEGASMPQSHSIPVSGFLSEKSIDKLAQNADALLGVLHSFCENARATADFAERTEKESGIPGNVFTQIATVTRGLAGTADNHLRKSGELLRGILERTQPAGLPELMGQVISIIRYLDDIAFQMNVITFNLNLNIARTSGLYKEKVAPIGNEYMALTTQLVRQREKVVELSAAFAALVKEDIQCEMAQWKETFQKIFTECTDRVGSVAALVRDEAQKAGERYGGSFRVIGGEIENIAREELPKNIEFILQDSALDSWIQRCRHAAMHMDDYAYRINILAFASSLEICRMPGEKGLAAASAQIMALAEKLPKAVGEMYALLDDIEQLRLLENTPVPPPATPSLTKIVDDMLLQACILYFYMNTEYEKIRWALPAERADAYKALVAHAGAITPEMHIALRESDDVTRRLVADVAVLLEGFVCELKETTKEDGAHGAAFAYIAQEYAHLAAKMAQAAGVGK